MTLMAQEGILLKAFQEDFSMANDAPRLLTDMKQALDGVSRHMIDDFRQLIISFSDLVAALAIPTRDNRADTRHHNIRKLILISTSELLRFGGNALKQQYGGSLHANIYPTLEAALAGIK
jgi:hypothetical protein